MRRLLTEFYSLSYRITKAKRLSITLGHFYVGFIFYQMTSGFVFLAQDLMSVFGKLHRFFTFPVNIATMLLFVVLTYFVVPKLETIKKDAKKNYSYTTLLVCTGISVLLWVYVKYGGQIFI